MRGGEQVSGNTEPLRAFSVLLRAVSAVVTGADVLYAAADLLTSGRNQEDRAHNRAVASMTARLLGLPDDPELMEQVLRNLPDRE